MAKNKKLTPRRMAREWAMQFLFQNDVRASQLEEEDLTLFWSQLQQSSTSTKEHGFERASGFADHIIRGVHRHKMSIDATLQKHSPDWSIKRMSVTDRNILRIGIFELLHSELPSQVVINEAVEISKVFCDGDSPKFINAILDNIHKNSTKGKSQ